MTQNHLKIRTHDNQSLAHLTIQDSINSHQFQFCFTARQQLLTDRGNVFSVDVEVHGALINDVEIVSFVALFDHRLPANVDDRKHGVEDVTALVLIQVREEHVFRNRLKAKGKKS